jgi:tRNA A-37 threonylcarbamoyl transferase component Bud32
MRPTGVDVLGRWRGYAHPSQPLADLALVMAGVTYTLLPKGRWRSWGKIGAGLTLGSLAAAQLYLAVDHPTDVFGALVMGWALPVVALRLAVPDDVFPVSYRRGRRAHLDVGGPRGEAIKRALDHQLGLDVTSVEPFGTEASAGSTPLRLRTPPVGDEPGQALFAKLYARTHLRSDRWYKLGRTVLYGRLEDEKPFSTVRRLVEYEDHMLRLLRDAGLGTPAPYGFAEITPEREYVIVMEFFEGAREIGDGPIDEAVIDEGLRVVRQLWDAGVAHRDVKPSNVLVHDGHVRLIDVAFATVRPTPWRQAVDLANMMLTLALVTTPELVYERALLSFAPEDIAEAFAASRSITVPNQLRARLRADERDLIGCFRKLAPERPTVPIQLWSVRRLGLSLGVLAISALTLFLLVAYVNAAGPL